MAKANKIVWTNKSLQKSPVLFKQVSSPVKKPEKVIEEKEEEEKSEFFIFFFIK